MVTALIGCGGVAFGSVCLLRFGEANACSPGVERLSWYAMVFGVLAVGSTLIVAAWLG